MSTVPFRPIAFDQAASSILVAAEGSLVLLDWLLWSHTFSIVIYHGGSLSKPTPTLIVQTLRKLRETALYGVLQRAGRLQNHRQCRKADELLRKALLPRVRKFCAGATSPHGLAGQVLPRR